MSVLQQWPGESLQNYTGTNSLVGSMGGVCPSIDNMHTDKSDTTLQSKTFKCKTIRIPRNCCRRKVGFYIGGWTHSYKFVFVIGNLH